MSIMSFRQTIAQKKKNSATKTTHNVGVFIGPNICVIAAQTN